MTNIGKTLCLVCGQISCEQVFYYSTLNVAITVAKNWRNQYATFASTSDGKTLFVQLHEKPTIDKDTGTILKLKLELAVRGNNTPHSVTLHARNRICPHCLRKGHITQLPPLAGQAPTFYIGLLGLPSVGKSVLLNAAFTGKVVSILNQALHGCKLETGVSQESLQIDATQLSADAMGLLKTVRVVATNGKLVADLKPLKTTLKHSVSAMRFFTWRIITKCRQRGCHKVRYPGTLTAFCKNFLVTFRPR